jgi:hypothetical protein
MFIDVDSIQITVGNKTINMGSYLLEANYGYHKLWGDDTGRNLAGTFSGSFKGVYPKITMQFRKLTKNEVEYLSDILDSPYQSVRYYDPNKKAYRTMDTYSNDWELKIKNIVSANKKTDGFSWAVISTKKRG